MLYTKATQSTGMRNGKKNILLQKNLEKESHLHRIPNQLQQSIKCEILNSIELMNSIYTRYRSITVYWYEKCKEEYCITKEFKKGTLFTQDTQSTATN